MAGTPPRGDLAHGLRWSTLLSLLALAAAILLLWRVPYAEYVVYPFRLFATFVHELAHGLAALATGGSFVHFFVQPDLSGTAWSGGGIRWVVTSAGYIGCALLGNLLILLATHGASSRTVLAALGIVLGLLCLLFVRNAFGIFCGLALSIAFVTAAWRLPTGARDMLLLVLAMQLVLDGFNSLIDLLHLAGDPSVHTDARTMAELTGIPATLWALLWAVVSLTLLVVTLRQASRHPVGAPTPSS